MSYETLTLDDMLNSLHKAAGFESKEEKDEKGDEKGKPFGDKGNTKEKPEDKKDEGESKEDEKKEGMTEKSAAHAAGAALAKELMAKQASTKTTGKGEEMNKQAAEAGKALAQALMKRAGVGDTSTTDGIPAGVVPNKIQEDNAAMKSQQDMVVQNVPGTDGRGNGGTVNQIFDAIVSDAMAQGVKDLQTTGNTAQAEGAPNARQVPAQLPVEGPENLGQNQEKMAAVSHLITVDGYDFDTAVALVKQASDAIDAENEAQVKKAAFNELLSAGYSFADAAAMVKSAGAAKTIEHEKAAAVSQLLDSGVDFDTAIELVEAKASQIYGK